MPCRHSACEYSKRSEICPFHAQGEEAKGFEVQDPEIEKLMRDLGRSLKKDMPLGWGFTLLIFSYDGEGFFYISSAERASMMEALQEMMLREGYVFISSTEPTNKERKH
jgi:hypothetical protein